jgi:hypothetical protein
MPSMKRAIIRNKLTYTILLPAGSYSNSWLNDSEQCKILYYTHISMYWQWYITLNDVIALSAPSGTKFHQI